MNSFVIITPDLITVQGDNERTQGIDVVDRQSAGKLYNMGSWPSGNLWCDSDLQKTGPESGAYEVNRKIVDIF